MVYKVLIALHLCRAITPDCLVMIRDIRVIEGIHAQIQHAVIRVLVLQNVFIYRPLCKGIPELAF